MPTLLTEKRGIALSITLNRPQQRNAISLQMIEQLLLQLHSAEQDPGIRALLLRGAGGNFCAGGDIGDMQAAQRSAAGGDSDAIYRLNRRFGELLYRFNNTRLVVVAALEGAVMGGGLGLACVADIAIADANTKFSLPETRLGLPPAQIAPFVVARIGLSQARRLALSSMPVDAREALQIGLVHRLAASTAELDDELENQLQAIRACAPKALASTKRLLWQSAQLSSDEQLQQLLDSAARQFADAIVSGEGREGACAFVQKRQPEWQH